MMHDAGWAGLDEAVRAGRRRALAADPAEFWREAAHRLHERARHREALRAFSIARALDGRADAVEGFAWLRLGWPERARPVFEEALARDPRDGDATAGLALLRRCDEGVRGAVETFRAAEAPESPERLAGAGDPFLPGCGGGEVQRFLRGDPFGPSAHLLFCPDCRREAVARWDLAASGGSERSLGLTLDLHDAALRRGEGRFVTFPDGSRARIRYGAPDGASLVVDSVEPVSGFEPLGFALVREGAALPASRRGDEWTVALQPAAEVTLRIALRATGRVDRMRLAEVPQAIRRLADGTLEIRTVAGEAFRSEDGTLPETPGRFWRQGEGSLRQEGAPTRGLFRIEAGAAGARIEGAFPGSGEVRLDFAAEPFPDSARESEALRRALEESSEPEALDALDAALGRHAIDGLALERAALSGRPFEARIGQIGRFVAETRHRRISLSFRPDAPELTHRVVLVAGERWFPLLALSSGDHAREDLDLGKVRGRELFLRIRTRAAPERRELLEATKGSVRVGTLRLSAPLAAAPGAPCRAELAMAGLEPRSLLLEPDPRGLYVARLEPAEARRESTFVARWQGVSCVGFIEEGLLHLEMPSVELPPRLLLPLDSD